MTTSLAWIGVGLLGALGAHARFSLASTITARRPGQFPLGTFVVNVTGGFVLGLLVGLSVAGDTLLLLGTGFLGSFTTFSTWMVEAERLGEDATFRLMWLYLPGSMVAGLATTGAGWILGGGLA
jgi:CrcB protein